MKDGQVRKDVCTGDLSGERDGRTERQGDQGLCGCGVLLRDANGEVELEEDMLH